MPFEYSRYVTPIAKARVLKEFYDRRLEPVPDGNMSGRGYPDSAIIPFCDWLNSFEGVVTLQSCEGHQARSGNIACNGVLWIWLDRELSGLFRERASEIARPPIERVCQVFSGECEFTEVIFNGNESGQLDKSLSTLKAFMASLIFERNRRKADDGR